MGKCSRHHGFLGNDIPVYTKSATDPDASLSLRMLVAKATGEFA